RDDLVTGVQTCALPIYRRTSDDARVREHAAHGGARRASSERASRRGRGHRTPRQPVERKAPRRRNAAQGGIAEGPGGNGVPGARSEERRGGKEGRSGWR